MENGSRKKWIGVLLGVILVWSLALRVGYGSFRLDGSRFFDERITVANVRALMDGGDLRPANGFYPTLSYLPQVLLLGASEGLHRLTGREVFAVFQSSGTDLSPTGYALGRLLQTLYGVASVWLTFLLGRRLFSPRAGLLGALVLAASSWHVHASAEIKPDALLLLTTLLALLWSLRAVEEPSPRRYALAGVGVALAVSSKLTGAVAGVPLLLGGLIAGRRDRRHLGGLLTAGASCLGTFLLLNPYFRLYFEGFGEITTQYAEKATLRGTSRLSVLRQELELVLDPAGHGPLLGSLALIGLAGLLATLARRRGPDGRWVERAMFVSYPIAYSALYALVTPRFKANNFVPVLAFTALFAAWALDGGWELARRRAPLLRRPAAGALALALLLVAVLPSPSLYVYRSVVPTTEDLARNFLRRQLVPDWGRLAVFETWPVALPRWQGEHPLAALDRRARLDELPPAELDLADAEVFLAERLDGDAELYARRIARVDRERVTRLSPAPFRARGPSLVAVAHPWQPYGRPLSLEPRPSEAADVLTLELPAELAPGEVVSLAVRVPSRAPPRLRLDGRPLELFWSSRGREKTHIFISRRFRVASSPGTLALSPPAGSEELAVASVHAYRWRASGAG